VLQTELHSDSTVLLLYFLYYLEDPDVDCQGLSLKPFPDFFFRFFLFFFFFFEVAGSSSSSSAV
jgi:hypothetical protein